MPAHGDGATHSGAGVRKPPREETAGGRARWRVTRYGDLTAAVPDGSLCTASAEQIFPRDSVQRNCFELALYTPRDHDCISDRIGSGIRNCPRCRCRLATSGARPTPSTIDRAIIMLNDRRFWGYASGPSSSGNTLPSFYPLLARPCCSPQRPTADRKSTRL